MKKPQPKTRVAYDYNECRDYLQKKYGYDERDYAGRYSFSRRGHVKSVDESKPNLDFWAWVVSRYNVHNDCYVTFRRDELNEIDVDWVREIYARYLDEFAENGELQLHCWW